MSANNVKQLMIGSPYSFTTFLSGADGINYILYSFIALRYDEIKLSDWMFQVMWLLLTNQSALFRHSVVMILRRRFLAGRVWLFLGKH